MTSRHKTNMNNLRSEASNFDQGGGGAWLKLAEGRNIIRILPPWSDAGKFFQRVGFHQIPEKFSDKVLCVNFTFGATTCPICKRSKQIYEKYGKDAAKNYWPQKRAYLNALDMKAADGIVKMLEVGSTILNPILNYIAEEDSDDLVDLNNGFNIMLRKYKEANFTKYETIIKPGVFDLAKQGYDIEAILAGLHDLGALVKEPDQEKVMEILDGINSKTFEDQDGGGADPEQEQAPPKAAPRAAAGPGGNKRPAPVGDDDIPKGPAAQGGNKAAGAKQAGKAKPAPVDDDDIAPINDDDPDMATGNKASSSGDDFSLDADFDLGGDEIPF